MSSLPIIYVSGVRSSDPGDRAEVARAVRAACVANGFFYASGTGITLSEMDAALEAARTFFALPEAIKLALDKDKSFCGRGYERLSAQRLEAGAAPDLKEGFVIGTDLPPDDPRVVARWVLHGPNQWPSGMADWRALLETYHSAMLDLAGTIMRALALSLDVPVDYFDDCCRDSITSLRLLHYPPQPPRAGPDARGAGAHTDWGAITILLQDSIGGLQVCASDGQWIAAPPIPGTFVVNLGDLVPRWTNGLYRSTLHRVINKSGRERYSIPFFFDGRGDYVSGVIPSCLTLGEAPKFAPISVNAHLAEMFARTRAA